MAYTDRFQIINRQSGSLTREFLVPEFEWASAGPLQTPVILDDVAYIINGDRLMALDLTVGELLFSRTSAELDSEFIGPQIMTDGRQLFFGAWPELLVLNREGIVQDRYANPPGAGFGPTSIITQTHVFAWSSFNRVNIFDRASGALVMGLDSPTERDISAMALADQTRVVAYRDGTVAAFDVPFESVFSDGLEQGE